MKDKVSLEKLIQLTEEVSKVANEARYYKQECNDIKSKSEKLGLLLQRVQMEGSYISLYPLHDISNELFSILNKGLSLVLKCQANNTFKRVFIKTPVAAFRLVSSHLEDFTADVSWLLCRHEYLGVPRVSEISGPLHQRFYGIPSIIAKEPDLRLIWEKITILYTDSPKDRYDAAFFLATFAFKRHVRKLIIEDRLFLLLKLLNEGKMEEQEIATRVIGFFGCCPESIELMIHLGVSSLFAKILKQGPTTVQAAVAWAVSELAGNYPKCQDLLARHDITNLLVDHLAFVKVEEHIEYAVVSMKPTSITSSNSTRGTLPRHEGLQMKEMAARALWHLAKGNSPICRTILESRALLYFAVLLETGSEAVQYNSAMAVMEITTVAETDADLRESSFYRNSPDLKSIVDQLIRIIEEANSACLIPCIKTTGNLVRTIKTAARLIRPLLGLLQRCITSELNREVLIILTKFACTENDLHMDHCKAIISAGGAKLLTVFVKIGDQMVHILALVLLCYIALHVPHKKELVEADVLGVLELASKQDSITRNEVVEELLIESKSRLELYQSRGLRIPWITNFY